MKNLTQAKQFYIKVFILAWCAFLWGGVGLTLASQSEHTTVVEVKIADHFSELPETIDIISQKGNEKVESTLHLFEGDSPVYMGTITTPWNPLDPTVLCNPTLGAITVKSTPLKTLPIFPLSFYNDTDFETLSFRLNKLSTQDYPIVEVSNDNPIFKNGYDVFQFKFANLAYTDTHGDVPVYVRYEKLQGHNDVTLPDDIILPIGKALRENKREFYLQIPFGTKASLRAVLPNREEINISKISLKDNYNPENGEVFLGGRFSYHTLTLSTPVFKSTPKGMALPNAFAPENKIPNVQVSYKATATNDEKESIIKEAINDAVPKNAIQTTSIEIISPLPNEVTSTPKEVTVKLNYPDNISREMLVPVTVAKTYRVTFKVVNGTFYIGGHTNIWIAENVEGEMPSPLKYWLKTAIPATPNYGFSKEGSWDKPPEPVTSNVTYTYTFKELPKFIVTYNIVGGKFGDKPLFSNDLIAEHNSPTTIKIKVPSGHVPDYVPNTYANAETNGPTDGSWDKKDIYNTPIYADTTYTYTYNQEPRPTSKPRVDPKNKDRISYLIAYKVSGGKFSNGDYRRTEQVFYGETLKNIPTDMEPYEGFENEGSWNISNIATTIMVGDTFSRLQHLRGDYTFYYTYPRKKLPFTVTYKVENGTFGGTNTTVVEKLPYVGATQHKPTNIHPNDGFTKFGWWSESPIELTPDGWAQTFTLELKPKSETAHIWYTVVGGSFGEGYYVPSWGFNNLSREFQVPRGEELQHAPTNMKPIEGYTNNGSWTALEYGENALLYTYNYISKTPTVTYKVVGGTFGGTDTTIMEKVPLGRMPKNIPTNMQPDDGFENNGSWNIANITTTPITGDVTYTYTYTSKLLKPVMNPFVINPMFLWESRRPSSIVMGPIQTTTIRPSSSNINIINYSLHSVNGEPRQYYPHQNGRYNVTLNVTYTENDFLKRALVTVPTVVFMRSPNWNDVLTENIDTPSESTTTITLAGYPPTTSPPPSATPTLPPIHAPKTGDNVNHTLYTVLLTLGIALGLITFKKKRVN